MIIKDLALPNFKLKIDLITQSQPYDQDCQIQAKHDLEAIACWLKQYAPTPNTFRSYKRQSKLFLMWCCYERGVCLGSDTY